MKMTSALRLSVKRASGRLFHFVAAARDRRGRWALLAALALPCFSGQAGAATGSAPKVTITSPAPGARTSAPVTFRGTASDTVPVTSVNYWITNLNGSPLTQGQAVLAAGPGSASNWTASLSPSPGTNIFAVQSQDLSANLSPVETVKFFVKFPALLTVATNGSGSGKITGSSSISGDAVPANGALLNVGEGYSIRATPDANSYFADWTGTAGATNGQTLNFIMENDTSLTANFITNIFLGMAGTYNGLFPSASLGAATEETAGMIVNLTLNSRGSYSGVVLLGGSGFGISGGFTPYGYATNVVTNALDGHVTVELQVNGNSQPRTIVGSVSGTNSILVGGTKQPGWNSEVALIASLTNTSNFAPAYTMLIPPAAASNGTNSPSGYGYALLTNTLRTPAVPAAVTFTGLLADWAGIAYVAPIREDNAIPIYLNYYNTPQPGMLFGLLNLASNAPFVPSGNLTWIRKAGTLGLFTNGFTNFYPVVPVSPWSNSVHLGNIITTNQLILSGGALTAPLTYSVQTNGTNLVLTETGGSTNHASGSVNTNTGQLTITFTNDSKATVTGRGAILQNTNGSAILGGGFFIVGPQAAPTNSGSISLQ